MFLYFVDFFLLQGSINAEESRTFFTYKIIKKYPHNTEDFTEGFTYQNGEIYESTGQYGQSKIKKYTLGSTKELKSFSLPIMFFGEGSTVLRDRVYQLTWHSRVGFIYNRDLELVGNFSYKTEGWGLTTDNKYLIMSDGSNKLYFLDTQSFSPQKIVEVYDGDTPVFNINELEYIRGKIYANIFMTNMLAIINPESGNVDGWIDLTGLLDNDRLEKPVDVLNGIAYDNDNKRLFVTGKYWPYIYEIQLLENVK